MGYMSKCQNYDQNFQPKNKYNSLDYTLDSTEKSARHCLIVCSSAIGLGDICCQMSCKMFII